MNQPIKNIIFDYGNVIYLIDFNKVAEAFKQLGITNAHEFYGHRQQDSVFDALDRGHISPDGFRNRIRELADKPNLTDAEIDDAWNTIFIAIPDESPALLSRVKQQYRTFLLSNTNAIHFDFFHQYMKEKFNMDSNDELFEKVYYSHLMGKRKPDAEIFEQVLQENNLDPEETLFIDDSPQHLETAKKLGLQTYLMTAPDNIQQLFTADGLLKQL